MKKVKMRASFITQPLRPDLQTYLKPLLVENDQKIKERKEKSELSLSTRKKK